MRNKSPKESNITPVSEPTGGERRGGLVLVLLAIQAVVHKAHHEASGAAPDPIYLRPTIINK